ncbi:MAG: hypothetical protein HYY60_01060 [Parcubacteria group bacterium]|nr:hypothetical protein [Parcubacteria group bacterium]MBI3075004.1 hypothetical protein [Parcubacteria group bacterium]
MFLLLHRAMEGDKMLLLGWKCPECDSALTFEIRKGLVCPACPDEHGPYQTAWKPDETGTRRQYLEPVKKNV